MKLVSLFAMTLKLLICVLFAAPADAGPLRHARRVEREQHRHVEALAARGFAVSYQPVQGVATAGVSYQAVQVAPYVNQAYQAPAYTPAAAAWPLVPTVSIPTAPTVAAPSVCPTCRRPY